MKTMTTEFWTDLYPDQRWPGPLQAFAEMAMEIHALRMLTDELVGMAVEGEGKLRSMDEIQRAHDLVGRYCQEANDHKTFEHVSALCWVLKHEHNTTFPQILEAVEEDLKRRGIKIVRLPEVVDPAKEVS